MTKSDAVAALREVLTQKWGDAKRAFDSSRAGATSEQSKSEGKYDTRGLEESYLAHGLSKAVIEYEKALSDLESCANLPPTQVVSIGSLVRCSRDNEYVSFLLSYSGGGAESEVDGEEVTIITPESPLAKMLLGKRDNDRVSAFMVVEIN